MNYVEQLKKAIAGLQPLQDKDPIYYDCLAHLQSELRKYAEAKQKSSGDVTKHIFSTRFNNKA